MRTQYTYRGISRNKGVDIANTIPTLYEVLSYEGACGRSRAKRRARYHRPRRISILKITYHRQIRLADTVHVDMSPTTCGFVHDANHRLLALQLRYIPAIPCQRFFGHIGRGGIDNTTTSNQFHSTIAHITTTNEEGDVVALDSEGIRDEHTCRCITTQEGVD